MSKLKKINKKYSQLVNLESQLDLLLKGQENNSDKLQIIGEEIRRGFIGLALRNEKLLKSNDQLKQQLNEVQKELNAIKKEREAKAARKKGRANRKRLPKRDPMTREIYRELIQDAKGPTYINVRLRLALCLLAVTGIRINELLPLKVNQLQTLIKDNWIAIDRSKRGPSSHKAFLTSEGKKLLQDRQKDFELIFLMKESDSYVFTSEANHSQILRRETITKAVNKVMHSVSNQFSDKPNITSHSFRIGYITQLWRDSQDIEFVKQTIGHRKLDTTSAYVSQMTDQERQKRISNIEN